MAKPAKELTQQNYDAIRNHLFDRIQTTGEIINNDFPNILRAAIENEAWRHFCDLEGRPFEDLVSWLHYTFPNGTSMGQGQHAITYEEAMALTEAHPEIHKVLAINAPKKTAGSDRRSKNAMDANHASARKHDFLRHRGNTRAVMMARLAQEYPKFYDAFMAGKYKSLRAATDAAGLTKPGHKPVSRLKSTWNRATPKERKEFLKWIQEQEK